MKKLLSIFLILLLLSGCAESGQDSSDKEEEKEKEEETEETVYNLSEITQEGTYIFNEDYDGSPIHILTDGDVILSFKDVTIESDSYCIYAEAVSSLTIQTDGKTTLKSTSKNEDVAAICCNCDLALTGSGVLYISSRSNAVICSATVSIFASVNMDARKKGILAERVELINGTTEISAGNDGIHAADILIDTYGSVSVSCDDDALHADNTITIEKGSVTIDAHEGLEAYEVTVNGGDLLIYADDDGINATGKGNLIINGGSLRIISSGDGIDSNGNIIVNGGDICIVSANDNESSAVDYDKKAYLNGGTLIAYGSNETQTFSNVSSQQQLFVTSLNGKAGDNVTVYRNSELIYEGSAGADYSSILFSCEEVVAGMDYEIRVNNEVVKRIAIAEKQSGVDNRSDK